MQKVRRYLASKENGIWFFQLCWLLGFAMVFKGTFLIRRRPGTEFAVVDVYNLVNIVVTFAIAAVLAIKWHEVVLAIRRGGLAVGCIVYYYLACAASGLWSLTPEYSTYRALEFLIFFLMVLILVRNMGGFLKAERLVLLCVSFLLLMEIVGQANYLGWNAFGSNSYGMTGGMLFAYSFGELATATGRRKLLFVASSLMGLMGVFLAASTGSNLAMGGALLMLLILSPSHIRYVLPLALALLLVQDWAPLFEVAGAGKSLDDIVSLQHRGLVWVGSWELFLQRPLLGYGFNIATKHFFIMGSAHNSYLEALLNVGILGASVLFFGCTAILWDLGCAIRNRSAGFLGCFVTTIVYLVNSLSHPAFGCELSVPNIVFTLILALFIYHAKPLSRRAFVT